MHMDEDRIKCCNISYLEPDFVKHHLYKVDDSYTTLNEDHEYSYREMVIDAMAPDFTTSNPEEALIAKDKLFFLYARELWFGCKKATQQSVIARLLNIKLEYRIPERCYDGIFQLMKDGLLDVHKLYLSTFKFIT
uniref:Uncharacterized protein n=1 Tax=Lactuca sativa TaxID=4236 RepID=A0A9R1XHA6_LACSA|nr:hypothetical protein LSAT_V11C400198850 [Lactuca sativa]